MMYWIVVFVLFVYFIFWFIILKIKGKYLFVDIVWGGGFVVVVWIGFLMIFSMIV